MKKTLTPRRAVCGLLAALAAAAAVWLLCRWVGYDLQLRLGDKQQFEIVNDDYSQIIDVPDEGLVQTFPLKAGQSICGVRLNFSTHDALYKCGMVMVDLYDENGQLLGQGAGNFLNIFNDSFTAFAYGGSYTAEKDEELTLHIYNEVAWDGPLGLWASEGTVPGMPLYAGDTAQDATLALQIMTDRSADWPTRLAQSLAPLLAAAAFAAVLLCVWRAPAVLYLAAVGLACGLAFVRVTPALTAPDEYTHLAAAYEQASRWGGQTAADENGRLLVRACDAPYFGTRTGDIGIFAYKQAEAVIEQAQRSGPADPALTVASEAKAGQGSGSYLPQALGIWLARARGADFYTMLRTGRICNLLLYLALAALAAALAPAGVRGLLACVAVLPMPLQLAASLSPDASVLGTVFCYTALCLRLCGKKAALWEKLLLVVLGGIVGPAKAIYLPVVLLCFVIPADNLAGQQELVRGPFALRVRSGRLIQAATLVLAGCLWLATNLGALAYAARDVSRAVLAAGAAALAVMLVLVLRLYAWARTDARRLCRLRRGLAAAAAAVTAAAERVPVFVMSSDGGAFIPALGRTECEIFSVAEEEIEACTGIEPSDQEKCMKACIVLSQAVKAKYIILRLGDGDRGYFLFDGKYYSFISACGEKKRRGIKTDGVFSAALVLEYMKSGGDIKRACGYAAVAAAAFVSRGGGLRAYPSADEIRRYTEKYAERAEEY